ncbi:MAG: alpha/beta hydrolase [Armatimonadetes bacterium]|nr:alpha/beta hydrolase [Armatimonadota bacterium]
MIKPDALVQAIANNWETIAGALGPDRERIEYQLIALLRQLDLTKGPEQVAAVQSILDLLQPFSLAYQALLQAVRDIAPELAKGAGKLPAGFAVKDRYTQFPVFFGTDRAGAEGAGASIDFSGERGELSYGVAEVSIPDDPRMGKIERPRWWKLQFREDPQQHVVVHSIQALSESDFVAQARKTLGSSAKKEVLVFMHGYLVGFHDAVVRAAQTAYDLHFEGLAALYSWPSEGSAPRYTVDETNVGWSRPHFAKFLTVVREHFGADTVHLLAHSMGNRLLVETLAAMTPQCAPGIANLNQIVFAAPDIDAATFKDLAETFGPKASRFTLYASSDDIALKASKAIHKYSRAGESGLDLVVAKSVDTVDVTTVDTSLLGHSYYGENRSVLADMFYVIRNGTPPDERFGLVPKDKYGLRYWAFRP